LLQRLFFLLVAWNIFLSNVILKAIYLTSCVLYVTVTERFYVAKNKSMVLHTIIQENLNLVVRSSLLFSERE